MMIFELVLLVSIIIPSSPLFILLSSFPHLLLLSFSGMSELQTSVRQKAVRTVVIVGWQFLDAEKELEMLFQTGRKKHRIQLAPKASGWSEHSAIYRNCNRDRFSVLTGGIVNQQTKKDST